uniref:PRELI/MSF1 domain-containing protein n=1 Tax=Romanomermis culicivorax TaxID=13658 RepID=A0A915IIY5_ROMCU
HTWDTVVHAAWRKYPNPLKPEVTGLDVIDRKLGEDGILRSKRILRTEWSIPRWVSNLIGLQNPSYSYEYSEVRLHDNHMVLKSKNLNCTNFVDIDETLVYKRHPENDEKTVLQHSAVITMHGVPLLDYCENLLVNTFNNNAY